MEAPDSAHTGVTTSTDLDLYFASVTALIPTQDIFTQISHLLRLSGHSAAWYQNPKLYYILRRIKREEIIGKIIDAKFTDLWLPFPKRILQKVLGANDLRTFIAAQDMCLDEEIALPLSGQHYSFEDASIMEFQELKVLGAGGYGEVQHMKDPRNGKEYARKVMVRPANAERHHTLMHQFRRELNGMRRVRHRHCVTFRASFTDSDFVAILSTPVAEMDLAAFLDLDLDVYQLATLRKAVGCITAALSYLHGQGIRHDDLKPNNILMYRSEILLTDFGFCLDSSDSGISTTTGAPQHYVRRYSAPEVFEHEPRNRLTDIWGLGCVLFEVLSRLRGFKLKDMRSFWTRNGNRYDSFAENSDATAAWFAGLTNNQVTLQHGSNRSELFLISFVYRVLLESDRLLRPTARQVLDKLVDLELVYPDMNSRWTGNCCSQQIAPKSEGFVPNTDISFRGDIPQWPLLDLETLDSHLAYLFLDTNLDVLAKSHNLSYLEKLGSPDIAGLVHGDDVSRLKVAVKRMLQNLNLVNPRRVAPPALRHIMRSMAISRIQDTIFWFGFLNVYWEDETTPRLRTVQLSLSSICLERQSGKNKPFLVMTFDPNEWKVEKGPLQQIRDLWIDGLGELSVFNHGRARYKVMQGLVNLRRRMYLRLLNERRTTVKVSEENQCMPCERMGIECSGSSRGVSCEQCLSHGYYFQIICEKDL